MAYVVSISFLLCFCKLFFPFFDPCKLGCDVDCDAVMLNLLDSVSSGILLKFFIEPMYTYMYRDICKMVTSGL